MSRRNVLTKRQATAIFDLPTDEPALIQHYTLADDDIEYIRMRRRPENQLGFALQLCAFRYSFIPRIRDLKSKRLYVFEPKNVPKELKGLIGGKVRDQTFIDNWPDVLRCTATMTSGKVPPSQLLKQLSAGPRKHDLAIALGEIGRIERTLFMIEWALDIDMQRRANVGLNKGEAHHALKNALRIGRQGEIRDRTTESQHFRLAGLNLLTAIIVYWNTDQLGKAVMQRKRAGLATPEHLLRHISPLGWEHILLIGQYIWRQTTAEIA